MVLPHLAKHAFGDRIGPNVQKTMLLGSPPHQGLKIADFLKKKFILIDFFGEFFPPFLHCWPHFEADILFGAVSSTRVTKHSLNVRKNPYFERLADLWQIWPYSQVQGPYSVMQSEASPG